MIQEEKFYPALLLQLQKYLSDPSLEACQQFMMHQHHRAALIYNTLNAN